MEFGRYCAATEAGVRAFQEARGLRADGVCDEHTWLALVEASWSFGDRSLYLTAPNLRGDDVAELQTRLARLGFDPWRVDGIFGPRTAKALAEFQANYGLAVDAVCGADTVRAITVVSGQTGDGPGVAAVRERESLRGGPTSVESLRVVVAQFGGLSALTRSMSRELRASGATVMTLDEPDALAQARAANHFKADVYVGLESHAEPMAVACFYRVPTFESVAGRMLAEAISDALRSIEGLEPSTEGMRLPILRETKMPAVLLEIGPVRTAVDAAHEVAAAIHRALELWISRAG